MLLLSCSPFSGEEVEVQRGDLLPVSLTHKFTDSAHLGTQGELLHNDGTGAWSEHLPLEKAPEEGFVV